MLCAVVDDLVHHLGHRQLAIVQVVALEHGQPGDQGLRVEQARVDVVHREKFVENRFAFRVGCGLFHELGEQRRALALLDPLHHIVGRVAQRPGHQLDQRPLQFCGLGPSLADILHGVIRQRHDFSHRPALQCHNHVPQFGRIGPGRDAPQTAGNRGHVVSSIRQDVGREDARDDVVQHNRVELVRPGRRGERERIPPTELTRLG